MAKYRRKTQERITGFEGVVSACVGCSAFVHVSASR